MAALLAWEFVALDSTDCNSCCGDAAKNAPNITARNTDANTFLHPEICFIEPPKEIETNFVNDQRSKGSQRDSSCYGSLSFGNVYSISMPNADGSLSRISALEQSRHSILSRFCLCQPSVSS